VRLVLLALVVANIAFFAWARWIDLPLPPPTAIAHQDTAIPPLHLVTEGASPAPAAPASTPPSSAGGGAASAPGSSGAAAAAPAATAAAAASAPGGGAVSSIASASPGARCRSLGPFEDLNLANLAAERLRARGITPHDRTADTPNPNVYWVYIGELTSEMQRHAIQTLNAAGIRDAVSMTQPEQSDRVSVGVFADQQHAVKRAEQVRALGFKPTLGLRQKTVSAHWLDFELKAADPDPPPNELVGAPTRSTPGLGPVKMVDCPAESGSG